MINFATCRTCVGAWIKTQRGRALPKCPLFFCMYVRHITYKSLSAIKACPLYASPARLRSRIGGGRHHPKSRKHKQYYKARSIYTINSIQQCAQCVAYQHVTRIFTYSK